MIVSELDNKPKQVWAFKLLLTKRSEIKKIQNRVMDGVRKLVL